MKVLLTVASLLPDYGGPAFSVSGLATALTSAGAEVGLWAADQSALKSPLLTAETPVKRLTGTEPEALEAFGEIDILHDNGIWWAHNHRLAWLARARGLVRVVSTRGMLEPWALAHKPLRKKLAWQLYQRVDLKGARCHFVSSPAEAGNVSGLGLGVPVVTIPNGVEVPMPVPRKVSSAGMKTALFVGRIYPVKGLPMLIEAWSRVMPDGWILRIAGPDEAGHRRELEKVVASAALEDRITFTGPLSPVLKSLAFFDADLFVLPSHSESFGVVVAEALAHGLPVLTTTGAPWRALVEQGCGWWVAPTVDGLAEGLRQSTALDSATLQAMGTKGRALAETEFGWASIATRFLLAYTEILPSR